MHVVLRSRGEGDLRPAAVLRNAMPLRRPALSSLAITLAAAALPVLWPGTASACPGATAACPYTALSQVGQRGGGVLRFPQAIALGPDGTVYVGDQGSHTVLVFGPDGAFPREVGSAGTLPGERSAVGALAIAGDG
ncbi:MAG: tripartite motif-containing protein 71, partial [Solirubrobacteraceae bacterium]|nr:tripartite motif-containing protein 71 [Solirubrobacteraceae bacterium]